MNCYIIKIICGGEKYALWLSSEQEELVTKNSRILLFSSRESAQKYVEDNTLPLSAESFEKIYDIDALEAMCREGELLIPDHEILRFWEFFCDVAYTLSGSFAGNGRSFILNDIYDKLCMQIYAGNDDDTFELDSSEYELITGVLSEGARLFRENFTLKSDQ